MFLEEQPGLGLGAALAGGKGQNSRLLRHLIGSEFTKEQTFLLFCTIAVLAC